MPSETRVCPFCAERIESTSARCRNCHADLPALSEPPTLEPRGDKEVLGREPERSRGALMAAAGILAVVIVAYGATHVMSGRPRQHHSEVAFNWFSNVKNACDKDDGNLVTTDPHGTPMAFATPDGPQRYWCVSKDYLAAIGRAPQDPLPPVRTIPHEYKWLWPRTTYGQ